MFDRRLPGNRIGCCVTTMNSDRTASVGIVEISIPFIVMLPAMVGIIRSSANMTEDLPLNHDEHGLLNIGIERRTELTFLNAHISRL